MMFCVNILPTHFTPLQFKFFFLKADYWLIGIEFLVNDTENVF